MALCKFRQQMLLLLLVTMSMLFKQFSCSLGGEPMIDFVGNASQQLILFPSQGDLLIGRVPHLTASSTCGEVSPKVYCPIGLTKCFTCDSKHEWDKDLNPNSHKIGNVVAKIRNSNTTYDSWWMAEPGAENVTIQLDLDAKFTFTHLIMIFHSYRPKAWWLERSSDYGETYRPYGYFAEKCEEMFPWVMPAPRNEIDDVVCSSSYTDMTPSDRGQVVFNAIPQHISETEIFNVVSRDRREGQTDITNLRVHLVKYHTLSDEKLSSDRSELSKYYFGLYEMNVHGMCICNGHAMTCKPAEGVSVVDRNAVYGHCECMHNTQGPNCEECRDFYHDRKWAPATLTSSNECRRCQCYGHSNKCAFSQKKWDESGGISGGVCLDCMHNTTGDNCQRCTQGYFRDETKQLEDPDICAACECSSSGIREAFCEAETDKAKGLIAGHCHCKPNVGGPKCDRCKPGYWDLRSDNPDGCQVCDCLLLGTSGNQGCNHYTGQCPCKVNVVGEKCNRCKVGFFNLSQIAEGCSPCDCDIGGSLSPYCHPNSGECTCKPGFTGRKCDIVIDRYFVPHFDIDGAAVDAADSPDSGRFPRVTKPEEPTLTGRSGVRLKSPSQRTPDQLVILLRNRTMGLPAGEYDIALKVYPRHVNISVLLPVQLDAGFDFINCSLRSPIQSEIMPVPTTAEFRATVRDAKRPYLVKPVFRKVCIDPRGLDKITIQLFGLPHSDDIIIDAVIIGKSLDDPITYLLNKKPRAGRSDLPPFEIDANATMVTNLYNCLDYWKPEAQLNSRMPDECRRLVQSLSGRSLPSAIQCSCDGYGSQSPACDKIGGQCPCWPNIVGRTCNSCAPKHYGFGQFASEGCRPCGCSSGGSVSDECHDISGKCECLYSNIDGRQCDSCKTGYWNFPICLDCQCNGLAVDCHKSTGACLDCRSNTGGSECQDCKTGYYGDPRRRIACRPCQCPGGRDGTFQHAVTCQLKSDNPPTAKCNCRAGYLGDSCERCDVNYYGDPATGDCTRCSCNGNIDLSVPNSCDPDTGRCLKCLNRTTGANCEECKPGFYGQAAIGRCQSCVCSPDGTVAAALLPNPIRHDGQVIVHTCNRKTGQCDCLPNVEGQRCDTCKALHYNLTSRLGCTACNCDPMGSIDLQCDLATGQCLCSLGRGGRRCDQCQDLYYGDPTRVGQDGGCQPCDCHWEGSQTNRCDKVTGRCICKAAITGRRCDQCERGTTGALPNCTTCGECWYNWDKVIAGLNSSVAELLKRATQTAKTGDFAGDLGDRVNEVDQMLAEIWRGINESQIPGRLLIDVQKKLASLAKEYDVVRNISHRLPKVTQDLDRIQTKDLNDIVNKTGELNQAHLNPKRDIAKIKDSLTRPELQTPSGMLTEFRDYESRFNREKTDLAYINDSAIDPVMRQTVSNDEKYNGIVDKVKNLKETARDRSDSVSTILRSVEKKLPGLNKDMCIGHDNDMSVFRRAMNYCSDVCGGPSLDVCTEGNSTTAAAVRCADASVCENSAIGMFQTVTANVETLKDRVAAAVKAGDTEAETLKGQKDLVSERDRDAAQLEYQVNALKGQYDRSKDLVEKVTAEIKQLLASNRTTPSLIYALAAKIQDISAAFSDADVEQLTTLVKNLRGDNDLSKATEESEGAMRTVNKLSPIADRVVKDAEWLKAAAANVTQLLRGTKSSQDTAKNDGTDILSYLEALVNESAKLTREVGKFNELVQNIETTAAKVLDKLRYKLQTTQLNGTIAALNREQNGTRLILTNVNQTLDRAAARIGVTNDEYKRRQAEIEKLRERLKSLRSKVGGNSGLSIDLNERIQTLESKMTQMLARLDSLVQKLNGNYTVVGSLIYMTITMRSVDCLKHATQLVT